MFNAVFWVTTKENQESFIDTKASLSRLETLDLKQRMEKLEQRVEETETRVSTAEDPSKRHERVLRHLVRNEATLNDLCDDFQNRLGRNNLRIKSLKEVRKEIWLDLLNNLCKATLQLLPVTYTLRGRTDPGAKTRQHRTSALHHCGISGLHGERSGTTTSLDAETSPVSGKTHIL